MRLLSADGVADKFIAISNFEKVCPVTLREELSILRGEEIKVASGDPMAIPCIETSDPVRLCKCPVVSVDMITYNHESYIRQAIEGVMMQKTDFEFELVIGEDCSTDRTREICLEYQRLYPDKIRVLWWHENLRKVKHPAGGNGSRNIAHCRGEFIALCEGDDYWTDPLKLQKQVNVMRQYPNVGICFSNASILDQGSQRLSDWYGARCYNPGVQIGAQFFKTYCYGLDPERGCGIEGFIMTATLLVRASVYKRICECYEIFRWSLALGDKTLILGCATLSDGYYLADRTTVYRRHGTGSMATMLSRICRDSSLVKLYYSLLLQERLHLTVPFFILQRLLSYRWDAGLERGAPKGALLRVIRFVMDHARMRISGPLKVRVCWRLFLLTGVEWFLKAGKHTRPATKSV